MTTAMDSHFVDLTAPPSYFEHFPVARRMRHARGATIDEVESNVLSSW
jgi:hypothetical protein